jgi:hypothetical protein
MVACIDFFEMSEICRPKFIVRHSTSLLQFSMVGFSSRNLIIPNFSRCVRSLSSETHLSLYFYLNVIAASMAQAPSHQND